MNFCKQSAIALAALVKTGAATAGAILEAHITRIETFDPLLNCFTDRTFTRARAEAAAVDSSIAAGKATGPLAGVPIAVKNLFDVAGLPTRAGSKILRKGKPAEQDAPILKQLINAGAVLLGALNMDEFAYGFVTENAHDGTTRNPHDTARIAGGSSGGSSAAVAAGFAPITLGSDTNGSIRLPARLCGIFGLKPTYGRINRHGTFPFVDSFDHLGPFARSAEDLALVYDLLQNEDAATPSLHRKIDSKRVATLAGWFEEGAAPEMLDAVASVATAFGASAKVILPEAAIARASAYCITAFEGGQLHKHNLISQPENFDPATRPRLIAGALQPAETIYQAQRFRAWFRAEALKLFDKFDILLAPATPCTAPLVGQKTMILDGKEVPVRPNLGLYTQPISFIGLPVVCVPVVSTGLPRGVQLIGAPASEGLLLAASALLQSMGTVAAPVAALA